MSVKKLSHIAKTIRSKDAGINLVTFDIIFPDQETYEIVKKCGAISIKTMSNLFRIDEKRISDFVEFDVANAIKFTIYRTRPNGSPGDWDILGCQQYGPLMDIEIPWSEEKGEGDSEFF